ncbi:MAG: metal-dependent hydrolase [Pseudomonadota bacterium]
MKITWFGHSAFRLETDKARILVDPFFTGNPAFPEAGRETAAEGLTHIALTHGHFDHIGDVVSLAKETGATVIANVDLCGYLGTKGVENLDMGNVGGTVHHPGFSLTWVQAVHSAGHIDKEGKTVALGNANGLVFHFDTGESVYHMGDTDIFGDMALIEELHRPAIGLVPVGDRFTMGGAVAALACKRYFKFDTIIPCHFGSFPIIDQTADAFVEAMDNSERVKVLQPGETLSV